MPLPSPRQGESQSDFISRCMGNDVVRREFSDQEQRAGVCYSQWRRSRNNNEKEQPMMQMSVLAQKSDGDGKVIQYNNLTALQGELSLSNVGRRQYLGEEHVVAPVILMVEGVHCGSAGCAYYPAEELEKFTAAWNNRPLPVFHPEQNGSYVSCNDPEIIERQSVGQLFNVRYEHPRLIGDMWINRNRARRVAPEILGYVNSNRMMEVSTGLFNDWEFTNGAWNGEEYTMVVRNIRPDHLALLPGGVGACSVEDGCGAMRVNSADAPGATVPMRKRGDGTMGNADKTVSMPTTATGNEGEDRGWVVLRRFMKSWLTDNEEQSYLSLVNEMGYTELSSQIQRKLDRMDDGERIHFLEELFNDSFIYRVETRGDVATSARSSTLYYKRSYSANEDAREVTFEDDAIRVRKDVSYAPIEATENQASLQQAQDGTVGGTSDSDSGQENSANTNDNKNQEAKDMARKERVDALIGNEKLPYAEEDRGMLMGLEDSCFDQTEATCNRILKQQESAAAPAAAESESSAAAATDNSQPQQPTQPQGVEDWLEQTQAPREFKEMIRNSLQQYQSQRAKKIDAIVGNSQFSKEELQNAEDRFIDRLYETVRKPVYMGGGGPDQSPTGNKPFSEEEPLDLPTTNLSGNGQSAEGK